MHYSDNGTGAVGFEWLNTLVHSRYYEETMQAFDTGLSYDAMDIYTHATGAYDRRVTYFQDLDQVGRVLLRRKYNSSNPGMTPDDSDTFSYAADRIVSRKKPTTVEEWEYNSSNQVQKRMMYGRHSDGSLAIRSVFFYTYDVTTDLLTESTRMYTHPAKHSDHYTYDQNNRLIKFVSEIERQSPAIGWDTAYILEYTYDGQGDLVRQNHYPTYNFGLTAAEYYRYDNNHKLLERVHAVVNGTRMDSTMKFVYAYSAFGLPERFESFRWDVAMNIWTYGTDVDDNNASHRIRLYYELFWPTGVPSHPIPTAKLTIYPVPSADVISISAIFKTTQPFKATITDMQGRVLRRWDEAATKEYRRTLPVADLPAGVYVLQMEGERESAVKQFVKQ